MSLQIETENPKKLKKLFKSIDVHSKGKPMSLEEVVSGE